MKPRTILLVDDEALVLRVLRLSLEKAGFCVETRMNGKDALDCIEENVPDILITDIEMPLMTGRELCEVIVKQFPDRTWPIFVSTSLTGLEHREWSGKIENLRFVEKPVSARKLLAAIEKYFSGDTEALAEADN